MHDGMSKLTTLILDQVSVKYESQRNTHVILLLIMVSMCSACICWEPDVLSLSALCYHAHAVCVSWCCRQRTQDTF
jgi:hypothetical protein